MSPDLLTLSNQSFVFKRIIIWFVFSVIFGTIVSILFYTILTVSDFWRLFLLSQLSVHFITYSSVITGDSIFYAFCRSMSFRRAMLVVLLPTLLTATIAASICINILSFDEILMQKSGPYNLYIYIPVWLMTIIIATTSKLILFLTLKRETLQNELSKYSKKSNSGKQADVCPGLTIRVSGNHHLILFEEIIYISSHGSSSVIHTESRDYETPSLLKKIESKLPSNRFIRIHKGYVVSITEISHIQYFIGGRYTLFLRDSDDSTLPVGRKYAPDLKNKMGVV